MSNILQSNEPNTDCKYVRGCACYPPTKLKDLLEVMV